MEKEPFFNRLSHAWDIFRGREPTYDIPYGGESSYGLRPGRVIISRGAEKSIVSAVYTRMALDVASVDISHVKVDDNGFYKETMPSQLNQLFKTSANIDQTGRQLILDAVLSLFDEGVVAIVPVRTKTSPVISQAFEIEELRIGRIEEWYPKHVRVNVYDEEDGRHKSVIVEKQYTAIIENPLYSVMNEPNSTLQRLIRKLALLDTIDEQSGSAKLDIIIQLPYLIKTKLKREQADARREEIERQLKDTKYGVAYIDGSERITQLNRPTENNLLKQIEFLTTMLYNQLGISQAIFDGTANDSMMLNYTNRSLAPILNAITEELTRKFLTKTARTQHQRIIWIDDPFRFVPVQHLASIADTFTRNEILTSNELRGLIGFKPSTDPKADQLMNSNLNAPAQEGYSTGGDKPVLEEMTDEELNAYLDSLSEEELLELQKQYEELEET